MLKFFISFNLDNNLEKKIITQDVKIFASSEARRLMDPFVPFRTGQLAKNVKVTEDTIHYLEPYARKMYYGENLHFTKDYHPLATAKWNEVAMTSQKDKLANAIKRYITNKG